MVQLREAKPGHGIKTEDARLTTAEIKASQAFIDLAVSAIKNNELQTALEAVDTLSDMFALTSAGGVLQVNLLQRINTISEKIKQTESDQLDQKTAAQLIFALTNLTM